MEFTKLESGCSGPPRLLTLESTDAMKKKTTRRHSIDRQRPTALTLRPALARRPDAKHPFRTCLFWD